MEALFAKKPVQLFNMKLHFYVSWFLNARPIIEENIGVGIILKKDEWGDFNENQLTPPKKQVVKLHPWLA